MDSQVTEPINSKLLSINKDIDGLCLEDLKSIYSDIAKKISLLNEPSDVALVNNWYTRDPRNRMVEYTFYPKDTHKHTSCILFVSEFNGCKQHWVFTHQSSTRLTRKVLKNIVSAQAVKQMISDGVTFQYRGPIAHDNGKLVNESIDAAIDDYKAESVNKFPNTDSQTITVSHTSSPDFGPEPIDQTDEVTNIINNNKDLPAKGSSWWFSNLLN